MNKLKNYKEQIRNNWLLLCIVSIIFLLIIESITFDVIDNDFYHIASSGRWIVEHKSIQYFNDQFVLDGYKTIIQQWLYAVILFLSYDYGGEIGVRLFTFIQFILLFIFTYKLLKLYKINKKTSLLVMVIAFMGIKGYFNCRPEMISLILLELQLIVTEKYRQNENKKILYFLPLITLLEINLHGTYWVFHFVFLLPYIFPWNNIHDLIFKTKSKIIDNSINIKKLKDFILPVILMIGSLFINPYGYKMIMVLFYSTNIADLGIGEAEPISILISPMITVPILISIIITIIFYNKKKITSQTILFVIGLTFMELIMIRNIQFFIFIVIFLAKDILKDVETNNLFKLSKQKKYNIIFTIISILVCLLSSIYLLCEIYLEKTTEKGVEKAMDYLYENEDNLSELKVFTGNNGGGYLLWNGVGKIYFCEKTEPYLYQINEQEDILSEYVYLATYASASEIEEFLNKYDFDYLYLDEYEHILQVYLEMSNDYECVINGLEEEYIDNDYPETPYYLYKKIN